MFLRAKRRFKDGREHRYWSVVENCRSPDGRVRPRASGLTPRAILEKLSTMQMVDVHVPTTDGRHLVLPRRTEPTPDQQLLLHQLDLQLPEQPPPRLSAS